VSELDMPSDFRAPQLGLGDYLRPALTYRRWTMRLPYSVSYPVEDAPPGSVNF
jgi:hypothetical protein